MYKISYLKIKHILHDWRKKKLINQNISRVCDMTFVLSGGFNTHFTSLSHAFYLPKSSSRAGPYQGKQRDFYCFLRPVKCVLFDDKSLFYQQFKAIISACKYLVFENNMSWLFGGIQKVC